MKINRTLDDICEQVAQLLKAAPRMPHIIQELANHPSIIDKEAGAKVIRKHLDARGIRGATADMFIAAYMDATKR